MKLNPKALGLTLAIFMSLFWLIVMTMSLLTGFAKTFVVAFGTLHPFFSYSWMGLVNITIEHLICGFIIGFVFAWLYNKLQRQK